jgi:hypothetical protein
MKNIFLPFLFLFFISCGDDKSVNSDSLRADSALKAQQMKDTAPPPVAVSKDTMHLTALPPVFEGDIVMQISEDPMLVAFGNACKSKYNNAGMIFMRPRDNAYMVLEMRDTVAGMDRPRKRQTYCIDTVKKFEPDIECKQNRAPEKNCKSCSRQIGGLCLQLDRRTVIFYRNGLETIS